MVELGKITAVQSRMMLRGRPETNARTTTLRSWCAAGNASCLEVGVRVGDAHGRDRLVVACVDARVEARLDRGGACESRERFGGTLLLIMRFKV